MTIQKIVVGGVLILNNKVLILQRSHDEEVYPSIWELPSGKREPLESTEGALIREFKEETDIDVKILYPISVFDYQTEKGGEIKDSTQINFLVTTLDDSSRVKISNEHIGYKWINVDDINNYDITKSTREVIEKAFILYNKFN